MGMAWMNNLRGEDTIYSSVASRQVEIAVSIYYPQFALGIRAQ